MARNSYIIIFIGLFLLLAGRYLVFYRPGEVLTNGQSITLTATLLTEPKLSGNQQSFILYYRNHWRIFVTSGRFPQYHYGDSLLVKGTLKAKNIKSIGVEKTIYSLDYPKIIRSSNSSNFLVTYARFIRQNVSETFHAYLPQPADSLLMGIVFGINEGLPDDFHASLKSGGVLHVIAASGMNVSMVAGALFFLLGKVCKRQHAVIISILGVLFYAVLSGLQPSILRASIMGILVFSASILGRQHTAFLTLGITGYLLLLWKPVLIEDVGFQLSFLSTLGILVIKPLFVSLEKKWVFLEDVTTTVAAQIATVPVMFLTFGQYGVLSVLVNALVLWTIPPLMVLGSLAALLGILLRPLAIPFLYLSFPFLWYFTSVVEYLGKYNLTLTVTLFPVSLVIGYYVICASIIAFVSKKKKKET